MPKTNSKPKSRSGYRVWIGSDLIARLIVAKYGLLPSDEFERVKASITAETLPALIGDVVALGNGDRQSFPVPPTPFPVKPDASIVSSFAPSPESDFFGDFT